jgi:hypothetical protein
MLAVVAVTILASAAAATPEASRAGGHLELRLSDWRGFGEGAFFLTMIPAGEVTRVGDAPLGPKYVAPDARQQLRRLLIRERFFELSDEYGDAVIEGRVRRVTVRLDGRHHSVAVNDLNAADKPVAEIRRALRVWYGALAALSDPGSVQIEAQDRSFLKSPP